MAISDEGGVHTGLNLPGMRLRCGEMIEALERVGGPDALDLLTYDLDPWFSKSSGWPSRFDSERALDLVGDA